MCLLFFDDTFLLRTFSYRQRGAGRRSQVCGSLFHRFKAAGRRLAGRSQTLPIYKAAGRRSEMQDPWICKARAPSNKNTSPWRGAWSKKKLAPPQRECAKCQAICDFCTFTLPFFSIFNSTHSGTPSIQM